MNRKQRIKEILQKKIKDFSIEIKDNSSLHNGHNSFDGTQETHIEVMLKAKQNYKFNRLEIHREINQLLVKEFNDGLHSLEIKIN